MVLKLTQSSQQDRKLLMRCVLRVVEALRSDFAQKALTEKGDEAASKLRTGRSIEEIAEEF